MIHLTFDLIPGAIVLQTLFLAPKIGTPYALFTLGWSKSTMSVEMMGYIPTRTSPELSTPRRR